MVIYSVSYQKRVKREPCLRLGCGRAASLWDLQKDRETGMEIQGERGRKEEKQRGGQMEIETKRGKEKQIDTDRIRKSKVIDTMRDRDERERKVETARHRGSGRRLLRTWSEKAKAGQEGGRIPFLHWSELHSVDWMRCRSSPRLQTPLLPAATNRKS